MRALLIVFAIIFLTSSAFAADLPLGKNIKGACCSGPYKCSIATKNQCTTDYKGDGTDCKVKRCYVAGKTYQLTICQCAKVGGAISPPPPQPASTCNPIPCQPNPFTQAANIAAMTDPEMVTNYAVTGNTCSAAWRGVRTPAGLTVNNPKYDPYTVRLRPRRCPNTKWVVRAKINALALKQTIKISVPKWSNPAAPQRDRNAFNDFRRRLLAHERQHDQLDRSSLTSKYAAKIRANAEVVACGDDQTAAKTAALAKLDAQINAAFMEAWNEVEVAQKQLDTGPNYPIPIRCP